MRYNGWTGFLCRVFAIAGLLSSSGGQACGQASAALSPGLVSAEGAVQLDTGLGAGLSAGTIRIAGGSVIPNAALVEYSPQPTVIYAPMVQAANLNSLSLSTVGALRVPPAGLGLGFEMQRTLVVSLPPTPQRLEDRMGGIVAMSPALGATDPDGATGASAIGMSGLLFTSCLDLPAGCSGFETNASPVPVMIVARRTGASGTSGKSGGSTAKGTAKGPGKKNPGGTKGSSATHHSS